MKKPVKRKTKDGKGEEIDMGAAFVAIDAFICKTLGTKGEYTLVVSFDPSLKEVGVFGNVPPLTVLLMLESAVKEVNRNPVPIVEVDGVKQ